LDVNTYITCRRFKDRNLQCKPAFLSFILILPPPLFPPSLPPPSRSPCLLVQPSQGVAECRFVHSPFSNLPHMYIVYIYCGGVCWVKNGSE
jgi:hypothetical protein